MRKFINKILKSKMTKMSLIILININLFLFISSLLLFGFSTDRILKETKVQMMSVLEKNLKEETKEDRQKITDKMKEIANIKLDYESNDRVTKRKILIEEINSKIIEIEHSIEEDKREVELIGKEFDYLLNKKGLNISINNIIELKKIADQYKVSPHILGARLPKNPTTEDINDIASKYRVISSRGGDGRHGITPNNITVVSGLSVDKLESMLSRNMKGLGQAFKDLEDRFGINAVFAIGVAELETGYGDYTVGNNNLFNIKGKGTNGFLDHPTMYDSIMEFGSLLSRFYIPKGLMSVDTIGPVYCEGDEWKNQIRTQMQLNMNELTNDKL